MAVFTGTNKQLRTEQTSLLIADTCSYLLYSLRCLRTCVALMSVGELHESCIYTDASIADALRAVPPSN